MLNSFFSKKSNYYGVKTFTYFIPAPPDRKTGYQEKEFDSIMGSIVRLGFEIISISPTAYANEQKCGMWVICLLGAKSKEVFEKEVLFDTGEGINADSNKTVPLDPAIIHD